jgi:hypothetical protein
VDNPFPLIVALLLTFWPVVVIGVVVVVLFVGGPLLGCVVFAIAGAAGARVAPSDETQDVDVTEFFEEQTTAAATAGRNDSI